MRRNKWRKELSPSARLWGDLQGKTCSDKGNLACLSACKQELSPLLKCFFLQYWISRGGIQGAGGQFLGSPSESIPVCGSSTPSISPSSSLGAARSGHSLAGRGDTPQQKKEATSQVQNLHLNRFLNPTVQIRGEGRGGRCEEFTESRTKIALLNTSSLFWTFSQWLLNLPRPMEKEKRRLHPLCAGFRRQPCAVVL